MLCWAEATGVVLVGVVILWASCIALAFGAAVGIGYIGHWLSKINIPHLLQSICHWTGIVAVVAAGAVILGTPIVQEIQDVHSRICSHHSK